VLYAAKADCEEEYIKVSGANMFENP